MEEFMIDSDLEPSTRLYRYMPLEVFMASVESQTIHLTNVNSWDDRWEVILSKIPTVDDKGNRIFPSYSFHQYIFGQCWSRVEESDAMWRIYSPTKTGVQIATSVEKFRLIGNVERWHLGNVIYFEDVADLLEKSRAPRRSPFHEALYKRNAFMHEREVRLLTHGDWLSQFRPEQTHITLPVDMSKFLEGVTIDPRADGWYVEAITKYCDRIGLAVKPAKSNLYESDPHLKVGLVRTWRIIVQDEPT